MARRMTPKKPESDGTMKQSVHEHAVQPLPANEQLSTKSCARCAGLLVSEWYYGLNNTGEHTIETFRCVQCGYRVDPVILQNQIRSPVESQHLRQVRPRYSTRAGMALRTIRPLGPSDVMRGQFRGYRREEGVAHDTQVETFTALRFYIDSDRWAGVPFYVRAGKCLTCHGHRSVGRVQAVMLSCVGRDRTTIAETIFASGSLSPDVMISLGTKAKVPGEALVGE